MYNSALVQNYCLKVLQGVKKRVSTDFQILAILAILVLGGVKPYRNPTYGPTTYSNMAYFPGEHFFYIFEKLNVFVNYCSLSLSLS